MFAEPGTEKLHTQQNAFACIYIAHHVLFGRAYREIPLGAESTCAGLFGRQVSQFFCTISSQGPNTI